MSTPDPSAEPVAPSDEELADLKARATAIKLTPGAGDRVAVAVSTVLALLARLDAAEAALVPEGVVTLNGKRWRVVRFTSDSGGKDARLVPYQPEDTK